MRPKATGYQFYIDEDSLDGDGTRWNPLRGRQLSGAVDPTIAPGVPANPGDTYVMSTAPFLAYVAVGPSPTDWAPLGQSAGAELRLIPTNSIGQLAAGQTDDLASAALVDATMITWEAADYPGSRISGVDATGIDVGDIRIMMNPTTVGKDAGVVALMHDSAASLQDNRILCPGTKDFFIPPYGAVILAYQDAIPGVVGKRWVVIGSNGWAGQSVASLLSLYPNMKTPLLAAGTYNDWNPVGDFDPMHYAAGSGIAGTTNTFADYSVIKVPTAAGGATITGLGTINGSNDLTTDWGPVKIIVNYGPGDLTFTHQDPASTVEHRLTLPNLRPLTLHQYEAALFFAPMQDSTGYDVGWRVIGLSQNFLTANASNVLPAGLTSDLDVRADVIELQGTTPCSYLDGLVPLRTANAGMSSEEIRVLKNVGDYPIFVIGRTNSASAAANRFRNPKARGVDTAPPLCIPPGSGLAFQYTYGAGGDIYWEPLSAGQVMTLVNTGQTIAPAAFAAAGDYNDYNPTDAASGLPGRFAHVWILDCTAINVFITGIEHAPAGLVPFQYGDRVLLQNLGSGLTIANRRTSAALNQISCPGNVDCVLSQYGSLELMYIGGWVVVGGKPS